MSLPLTGRRAVVTGVSRKRGIGFDVAGDLGDAETAEGLLPAVNGMLGHVDVLVCNHAHGGDAVGIADLTAAALDRHWAVNTRATLLLTKAFAAQHDGRTGGRVIWMT